MDWSKEAENAVKKVPFFVRKRVKARVEKEAREAGKKEVTLADVKTTQARYLKNMASEIKGYQVETCFGPGGCPNRAIVSDRLVEQIEILLHVSDRNHTCHRRARRYPGHNRKSLMNNQRPDQYRYE